MDINELAEMDNDELVVNATNDAPPPQDAMTTTTAAVSEEEERRLWHRRQVRRCPYLRAR